MRYRTITARPGDLDAHGMRPGVGHLACCDLTTGPVSHTERRTPPASMSRMVWREYWQSRGWLALRVWRGLDRWLRRLLGGKLEEAPRFEVALQVVAQRGLQRRLDLVLEGDT